MDDTDAKVAKAVQEAWRNLYDVVRAAEAAGLKVTVYVPQDTYDGAKALRDGDIAVERHYGIEIAVESKAKGA